jgi:type IV secretion system protein VirD4
MSFGTWFRSKDTTAFGGALGDAHFATAQEITSGGLLGDKGIRLGYYRDPEDTSKDWGKVIRYSGDAHLITVAPTGSGKGRDVLVGALLEYEGSCIVIDPKGQLAAITKAQRERMGQKIIVLNPLPKELPMDLGPSAKYNPMAYLDPDSDAFGPNCEAIADSIVMHEEGPNSHFSDSARQLIAGIIMHLAAHGQGGERNLVMMQRIVSGPIAALEAFIAEGVKSDGEGFISGKLARFETVNGEDRELRSIISTAITQCGFINNKAIGGNLSDSDFSFRDLKRQPTTVYLVLPAKYIEPCGKWFRLVLASAIAELWSDEKGKYPILAILDEFAQLGRLSVIADAMGMARGFGLQLWPILQDLTQLKEHYRDRWETFLGGAAVRQFFGPREHFTADYVSKLCGVKTVIAQGQSVQHARDLLQADTTGASWGQHAQPLLHPHNVNALGPQESLVLGPQNIVIDAFRKPYFDTEELAALASPDPYHKQDTAASVGKCPTLEAPAENFAEREWAAIHATKNALARKPPLFLRLLTPGRSGNPVLNVARKIEYLVTLPLRLVAALFAAPFAIHNRPLGALLAFVALFGFWELFDSVAKQPLTTLFEMKSAEYQLEDGGRNGSKTSGDVLYSNYRAAKWVIGAEFRALKAAFSGDKSTNSSAYHPSPTNGSWIENGFGRMSRSLDAEMNKSFKQTAKNIVADLKALDREPPQERPAGQHRGPQLANSVFLNGKSTDNEHRVVVLADGVRFVRVRQIDNGIIHVDQVDTSTLEGSLPLGTILYPQTGERGVRVGVNIGRGVGTAYLYHADNPFEGFDEYVLVPAGDLASQIQRQRKTPSGELLANSISLDGKAEDDRHAIVVSADGVRFVRVPPGLVINVAKVDTSKLSVTLPVGTLLVPEKGEHGARVGVNIDGVGTAYLYHALRYVPVGGDLSGYVNGDVLVPARDLVGRTQPKLVARTLGSIPASKR